MSRLVSLISLASALSLSAAPYNVYVGNATSNGISMLEVDSASGVFSTNKIVASAVNPSFMVSSQSKDFFYSTNVLHDAKDPQKNGGVSVYQRHPNGNLALIQRRAALGKGTCHISLDATGQCLFAANYHSGNIASYKVGSNGKISPIISSIAHSGSGPNQKRQTRAHAHSIYASPDSRFVYAADLGSDSIEVYTLNTATAELKKSSQAKCPPGSGPRHLAFSKDASSLYALNELTTSITWFKRDAKTGKLSPQNTVALLGNNNVDMTSSEISLSDDGKFVYAANRDLQNKGRDTISVLAVQGNGSLKLIQNLSLKYSIPRHFDISPDGKLLIIAFQNSNQVVSYHRNPKTGTLKATGNKSQVEKPMWIGYVPATK